MDSHRWAIRDVTRVTVICLLAAAGLTSLAAGSAVAAATVAFTPADDATVRESRPSRNYGSNDTLEVDASSRKDTLLKFDVTGVGTATVTSATLRLFAVDGSPTGGDVVAAIDQGWDESSVTWQNAPEGDGAFLGSFGGVSPGSWYELDVAPLVGGDGQVSVRISSTSANGADYSSKEHPNGNAPQLVIVTAP